MEHTSQALLWTDLTKREWLEIVIKPSPVPAGTVESCSYEQDDQEGDEQTEADDSGSNSPDECPLGHVDQG